MQNIDAILQVSVFENRELYEEIRRDQDICQALRELMKDEIAEERVNTKLDDIKKMMKNLKISAIQAMQALEIPEADQAKYSALL